MPTLTSQQRDALIDIAQGRDTLTDLTPVGIGKRVDAIRAAVAVMDTQDEALDAIAELTDNMDYRTKANPLLSLTAGVGLLVNADAERFFKLVRDLYVNDHPATAEDGTLGELTEYLNDLRRSAEHEDALVTYHQTLVASFGRWDYDQAPHFPTDVPGQMAAIATWVEKLAQDRYDLRVEVGKLKDDLALAQRRAAEVQKNVDQYRADFHKESDSRRAAEGERDKALGEIARMKRAEDFPKTQATTCARCGVYKHTPTRDDDDGYICAGCLEKERNDLRLDLAGLRGTVEGWLGRVPGLDKDEKYTVAVEDGRWKSAIDEGLGHTVHALIDANATVVNVAQNAQDELAKVKLDLSNMTARKQTAESGLGFLRQMLKTHLDLEGDDALLDSYRDGNTTWQAIFEDRLTEKLDPCKAPPVSEPVLPEPVTIVNVLRGVNTWVPIDQGNGPCDHRAFIPIPAGNDSDERWLGDQFMDRLLKGVTKGTEVVITVELPGDSEADLYRNDPNLLRHLIAMNKQYGGDLADELERQHYKPAFIASRIMEKLTEQSKGDLRLAKEISDARNELAAKLKVVQSELTEARLNQIDRVEQLENALTASRTNVTILSKQVEDQKREVASRGLKLESVQAMLETFQGECEKRIQTISDQARELERLQRLVDEYTDAKGGFPSWKERVDALREERDKWQSGCWANLDRAHAVEKDLSTARADIEKLKAQVDYTWERLRFFMTPKPDEPREKPEGSDHAV